MKLYTLVFFLVIPVSSPLKHLFKHIAHILMGSLITVLGVIYIPYILMPFKKYFSNILPRMCLI